MLFFHNLFTFKSNLNLKFISHNTTIFPHEVGVLSLKTQFYFTRFVYFLIMRSLFHTRFSHNELLFTRDHLYRSRAVKPLLKFPSSISLSHYYFFSHDRMLPINTGEKTHDHMITCEMYAICP